MTIWRNHGILKWIIRAKLKVSSKEELWHNKIHYSFRHYFIRFHHQNPLPGIEQKNKIWVPKLLNIISQTLQFKSLIFLLQIWSWSCCEMMIIGLKVQITGCRSGQWSCTGSDASPNPKNNHLTCRNIKSIDQVLMKHKAHVM